MFRWCAGTSTARWAVLITLCAVELVNVWSEASHAHHQREGRSGDERSGARGKRPIVCAQLQTGNSGPAGNREVCLLYTSDAADEEDSVDLGGRRIIKKKTN